MGNPHSPRKGYVMDSREHEEALAQLGLRNADEVADR